jgi:MFS family permease
LALLVRDIGGESARRADASRPPAPSWAQLSPAYRRYLGIVLLFSIGNSSDAFLILRAQDDMGVGLQYSFLLYALFNTVEAALGYPTGMLSDRIGRKPLISLGWCIFALVYLGFAAASGPLAAVGLFVLYGFYYTLTQGVQRALASDLASPARRATELGAFHMTVGLAALPASQLAGLLYSWNHAAPFVMGAACAGLAAAALAVARLSPPSHAPAS